MAVSAGSYLPWFRVDPRFDPLGTTFPRAYTTLAESGLHGVDLLLIGAVGVVLLSHIISPQHQVTIGITMLTGVGILLRCLYYPIASSWIGFDAMVVPVIGWYLTMLGGVLLSASGLLRLQALRKRPPPNSTAPDGETARSVK